MRKKSLDVLLVTALVFVVISGFAHNWQQVASSGHSTVSMSADGRIICTINSTSRPYMSTNSGKTWAIATNTPPWGCFAGGLAVSADGTKIIASLSTNTNGWQHWVFLSTDYGTTWTLMNLPGVSGSASYSVTCSADGQKLVAAALGGPVYYSTNTGLNWNTSSTPNMNWSCLASSADGRRMIGAAGSGIYFSTNFGAAWTPGNLSTPTGALVCTSSDGNWIGVAGASTYISSDGGFHWITNGFEPASIACSADGTNWIIGGPQVYTSGDGGKTWVTNLSSLPPALIYGVAASADFCQLIATATGDGIWSGQAVPSPLLNIQPQDSAVMLSWLLPSTNFVLQQNAALTNANWTTVFAEPTLNFTNLQQEISLPATGSNALFRLKAE